ncbi:tRNA (uracil-5-)-methyltransferase homolog B-like [Mustelus asterias]
MSQIFLSSKEEYSSSLLMMTPDGLKLIIFMVPPGNLSYIMHSPPEPDNTSSEGAESKVMDIGAVGLTVCQGAGRVIGIELIDQAVEDAQCNAMLNGIVNCEFLKGKAEIVLPELLPLLEDARSLVAVVNPSRAGLHYRVMRAIRNCEQIRRLVYISCKPEGEAMRNFIELCCLPDQQKKLFGDPFTPTLAVPVDMFPHTSHCELVLLFER